MLVLLFSCSKEPYNKITISSNDTTKIVQLEVVSIDTFIYKAPSSVPDSILLKEAKHISDSIRMYNAKTDSLHTVNFKKITKIINGGYNGYSDREAIWKRAKKVLSDTIN
ncbi:MAG: hypothetical protein ACK5KT_13985 [Dysgonomonas sp.]